MNRNACKAVFEIGYDIKHLVSIAPTVSAYEFIKIIGTGKLFVGNNSGPRPTFVVLGAVRQQNSAC
ncbi:hypothetical protein [Bifidobacterium tsurumiense]|uniref:Uncharacterized protein n=1 Tax=Bifidobacterium tsurumiense TaxID=356829 RepID=A0A087ECE9_9BIFI|nr:hypothetical protein [Bifidobacterium tsurumiense]KFJ05450.1 hypothetical protein BITS_0119 [Bifidobacterium tsurumiense]MDY4677889.1 hypothetical protein [Bifidobacterium tsurumiense]MSS12381.1 hypothetical protein [Bifidobacterium tsurumiense]